MSKRSRPQPITAPAPESFLPSFDFGVSPKAKSSAPLPPRKPVASLSKRLAAFTFLNLEDIVEETDENHKSPVAERITPPASSTSTKSARFWEFNRSKHTPTTPASLPPMSSKAYATLVGGGSSTAPSSKQTFSPPPSKVIKHASPEHKKPSVIVRESVAPLPTVLEQENPKSLAVDLVSIFSVSNSDDADSSSYGKTRFSFPMPPSSIPRRGSQSPLDPEMSFTGFGASPTSPSSDYSFFSPLFSAGFTQKMFAPENAPLSPEHDFPPAISPLQVDETKPKKKRHSIRPLSSLPPAAPPPRESPPPTPASPAVSTFSQRAAAASAAARACPSPDLDPELSAASSASSIASVMLSADSSAEESEADDSVSILGPMKAPSRKQSNVDPVDVWSNWGGFGAPSRSDSIVTLTQRAYNSAVRGSISTVGGPSAAAAARNGSFARVDMGGRNGSFGSSEMYGDWDQAIDELFSFSAGVSRKPSLASIAFAASADGAAHAGTSLDVLENTAFVMDDEMMRKFMESQFLVPTRHAPTPPRQPHATLAEGSSSTVSLGQTTSSATPSASATSSARSSLDEDRSTHSHYAPMTPVHDPQEHDSALPTVAPLTLNKGNKARPTPLVTSTRPPRPTRPTRNATMLSAAPTIELPLISPLDISHRPPPTQSVPSESSLLSPSSLSNLSLSPQSTIDVDSWPIWSSIDVALERRRDNRRPSAGAMTMISKFSDDSFDVRPKRRKDGAPKTIKKPISSAKHAVQNMTPGSSHTSYTFLGMKKKNSPSSSPTSQSPPRESVDSARSASSAISDAARREALRRPPLPLELFIRA